MLAVASPITIYSNTQRAYSPVGRSPIRYRSDAAKYHASTLQADHEAKTSAPRIVESITISAFDLHAESTLFSSTSQRPRFLNSLARSLCPWLQIGYDKYSTLEDLGFEGRVFFPQIPSLSSSSPMKYLYCGLIIKDALPFGMTEAGPLLAKKKHVRWK